MIRILIYTKYDQGAFYINYDTPLVYLLKLQHKYLTHTLKDVKFVVERIFKSSQIDEVVSVFEPPGLS